MKDSVRAFIAVETSSAVRQRAAELIAIYAATGAKVSWVKPHNMHLTLKFLDDVPLNSVPEISAAVHQAAAECEPFELEICTAGTFPGPGRPQTLWLGTGDGSEPLGRLHAALERELKPLGFPKEQRRFAAHLTIGRVRRSEVGAAETRALIKQHAVFSTGDFLSIS